MLRDSDAASAARSSEPPAEAQQQGEPGEALAVLTSVTAPVPAGRTRQGLARELAGGGLPVIQAAAVAAGGFVAGAALAGIVHRRRARQGTLTRRRALRAAGGGRARGAPRELLQVVGSRSLLVDVHLLGVPATDR